MIEDAKIIATDVLEALARLPSAAAHIWLIHWRYMSIDGEAYPTLDTLEAYTGCDRKTVIKWRNYLLSRGWIKTTGHSAAERYSKPTRGAHKVPVFKLFPLTLENVLVPIVSTETLSTETVPPKVYVSSYGSGLPGSSSEDTNLTLHPTVTDLSVGSSLSKEKNRENQTPKTKDPCVPCEGSVPTQTKAEAAQAPATPPLPPQAAAEPVKPRLKKSPHKYDAPFPPDFDADKSPTGVKYRREWIAKHILPPEKLKELAAQCTESSPTATAPSALWLAQELFRTVKQIPGVHLPVAAANWETKWPADFERLLKTYTRDELTDIVKVRQIRNFPAYAAHEIADEVADLHKIVQERKTGKYGWKRVEDLYQEKYGERRD